MPHCVASLFSAVRRVASSPGPGGESVAPVGQRRGPPVGVERRPLAPHGAQDLVRPGPLGDDRRAVGVGERRQPHRPLEDVEDQVAEPPHGGLAPAPLGRGRAERRVQVGLGDEREVAVGGEVAQHGGHLALAPRMLPGRGEQQACDRLRGVARVGPPGSRGRPSAPGRSRRPGPARPRRRPASGPAGRGRAAGAPSRRCAGRSRRARRRPSRWTAAGSSPRASPAPPRGGRSPRASRGRSRPRRGRGRRRRGSAAPAGPPAAGRRRRSPAGSACCAGCRRR